MARDKDMWGEGQVFRERLENAGDILRELSAKGANPDCRYIEEKITKLLRWLQHDFTKIPDEIQSLEDFAVSGLRWSDAVDGREYVARFHREILNKAIDVYGKVPVYSHETKVAKDLVMGMLHGEFDKVRHNLSMVADICQRVKRDGYINFHPL